MPVRAALAVCAILLGHAVLAHPARAEELPSFLQKGEAFCTDERDFNAFKRTGRMRIASAVESCVLIDEVTRVAVLYPGRGGNQMIRVMQGPYAAHVGWTNGKLPLAR